LRSRFPLISSNRLLLQSAKEFQRQFPSLLAKTLEEIRERSQKEFPGVHHSCRDLFRNLLALAKTGRI
jgi:hypothetical protein